MTHSLQGKILVSSPSVANGSFARSVLLVLQQNEDGACGVVLNSPVNHQAKQIWQKIGDAVPEAAADRCSFGGPMGGPIFALHQSCLLSEGHVTDDLYFSAETKTLAQLSRQSSSKYRIFLGMTGWDQGELENQVAQGKWYILPADVNMIFGDTENLWEHSLRAFGRQTWLQLLPTGQFPENPEHN